MKTILTRPISAFLLLAAFVASPLLHSQENPLNLPVTEGEVTKLLIRQGTTEVLPTEQLLPTVQPTVKPVNDWIWVLDRRRSVEFPVDRTGLIQIETQITHTYPNAVDTSMVDADGVLIDAKTNTDNPSYQFPPAKFRAPYFIRVHNPYGHPTIMIPITSGSSGHSDGTSFQRETPSESMESSSEYDESGESDEGEHGEESMYGGCGGCQSCRLSNSEEFDDITTDHPNGLDEPGEGDGAGFGNIPAGHSAGGDSKTNINFEMDFGSGVNMGDFKLHSLGDAIVTRNSSQHLSSIMTDSSYTAIEEITGGKIRIRHSSDPANAASTVFREITFENSATNEIKKTSVLYPGTANSKSYVTIWRRNPSLQTLECVIANGMRKKKITLETNNADLKVERHQIFERAAGASGEAAVLVSDARKTFVKNQHGWKKTKLEVLDESGGNPLVTAWTYYDSTTSDYAAGLLKSVTYPNGQVKQHQYSQPGAQHRHEIVSWFTAGSSQTTETRYIALGATTTEIVKKDTANGYVFEKSTKEWSSASQVDKKTFSSASGIASTSRTDVVAFGSDFGGKITNAFSTSDMGGGNVIRIGMTQQLSRSSGVKTITQASGQMNASNVVIDGQSMQKIVNEDSVVLRSITTVIQPGSANGAVSSDKLYSDFDNLGRARRVDYFPSGPDDIGVYHELRTYACCGAASSTDRYGVVSYIDYDDLGRVIKTNRLGVTMATVYDALTVHSHRYPGTVAGNTWTGAPDNSNTLGRTTRNLQGTTTLQFYRSPQTGQIVATPNTTTRYFRNPSGTTTLPSGTPADVGMRTVQVLTPVADDGSTAATQTSDYYRDGKVKETFGNLSPKRFHQYERNSLGLKVTQSYRDDDDTLKESVITQYDYAGRTLTVQQGPGTTTYHYTQDNLTRVTDADGVDTFYFYNAKGEQDKTVLDLDGNNVANESIDQVTRTISQPMMKTPPGGGAYIAVQASISEVIVTGTTYVTAGESYSTFDGLLSWSISPGTTTPSVNETAIAGSGAWTETRTFPDGTQAKAFYTNGRLEKNQQLTNESTPAVVTETTYAYDSIGRTEIVTDKRTGPTTSTYLNLYSDSISAVEDASENTTSFGYDHRGRRILVDQPNTDGHDNETVTKYEPNGNIKEVTGDQTYRSTYTYDYAYRVNTLKTYGTTEATTTWMYSETTGHLQSKKDAALKGASYNYTDAGRLKNRTWARGSFTRYDYDFAGRLAAKRYFLESSDSNGSNHGNDPLTGDVNFTYNRLSQNLRAISAASPDSSRPGIELATQYSSSLFRTNYNSIIIDPDLTSTTANGSALPSLQRTLHRKYEPTLGRRTGYLLTQGDDITSTLEAETTYRYSATNGRFGAITSNPVGAGYSTTHDFIYGYVMDSNLHKTTESFLNYDFAPLSGPPSGTAIHQTTRLYEPTRNVLDSISNTYTNGSTTETITASDYSVNKIGQREAVTRSGSGDAAPASTNATYTYNNHGELETANEASNTLTRAYNYDGIGNRITSSAGVSPASSTTYSVNALNQYTAAQSINPTYDDDGNATAYPIPVNPSANSTLTYDGENRLIKVVTTSATIEYTYDAISRRIIKTVGTQRTYYIYNGWNCVSEYTGAKHTSGSAPTLTRTQSYIWGLDVSQSMQGAGGVGGLLAVTHLPVSSSPETYYPCYDGNGNITSYIDEDCNVEASFDYDPFGNITNNNNPLNFNYAFSTKPLETETGLYYYGYRWYDPLTGRWPSRDPIAERGGLNIYGFVGNDVTGSIDYLGLEIHYVEDFPEANNADWIKSKKLPKQNGKNCKKISIRVNGSGDSQRTMSYPQSPDEAPEDFTVMDIYVINAKNPLDFIESTRKLLNKIQEDCECVCIQSIIFHLHGSNDNKGNYAIKFGNAWLIHKTGDTLNSPMYSLGEKIRPSMCEDAKIRLTACGVMNDTSKDALGELANASDSPVIAPQGKGSVNVPRRTYYDQNTHKEVELPIDRGIFGSEKGNFINVDPDGTITDTGSNQVIFTK